MDDAVFRATLVDYIQTRACVNAADEDVYMRFLEKQAVLEQATAVQQLASVRRVHALVAEIHSEVEKLRICGSPSSSTCAASCARSRSPASTRRPSGWCAP